MAIAVWIVERMESIVGGESTEGVNVYMIVSPKTVHQTLPEMGLSFKKHSTHSTF